VQLASLQACDVNEMTTLGTYLRYSQAIVGLARVLRGVKRDARVLVWLLRRKVTIAEYLRAHPVKKLQLATSNNLLPGWLNTDIALNHDDIVYLDATKRFPLVDNTFDCIMAEHMIEHVEYRAAQGMLAECYRVLKPGGWLRIATPDLRVLLALYNTEKTDPQRHYIDWAVTRFMPETRDCKDVFVINNFFRAWGHCFLYDQATLQLTLSSAGFEEITFYKPGNSENPMLRNLEAHGRELKAEDINQFETIVVEGRKRFPPVLQVNAIIPGVTRRPLSHA
jgi:predicted SAM-dependent methyltransferase